MKKNIMKIKKKLRDLTEEEYEKYEKQICGSYYSCYECPFGVCNIMCGSASTLSWIYHKDLFSDKFLDQEVEIEVPELLTKEDKEYLEVVLKPLHDSSIVIEHLTKHRSCINGLEYLSCAINGCVCSTLYIKKRIMFRNMKLNKEYTLEDLGLFKEEKPKSTSVSTKKKITLTEFWESEEKLAIHCNAVEEKANKLLEAFDKLDKIWRSGESYLENNNWDKYTEETCYDNSGRFGSYNYYKEKNYTIYEFEDVDLKN